MGKEFAEDFRLLQDIGWSEYEARETYVLPALQGFSAFPPLEQ
jgi:hypothetical protein